MNQKSLKLAGSLSIYVLLTGCTNVGDKISTIAFPAHSNSWKKDGESINLNLNNITPCSQVIDSKPTLSVDELAGAQSSLITGAATKIVDAAIGFVKDEGERYEASYSGLAIGDCFYSSWDARAEINLNQIEFKRFVKIRGENTEALNLSFDVEPTSDNTAFQILPSYLELSYSKAKIHKFNWFEPWTWVGDDNDLDLTVHITVDAAWIEESGARHFETVAEGEFNIRNVEFDTEYKRGDSDSPIPSGNLAGQLIPALPRSFISERDNSELDVLGLGNYIVKILITEIDDYGEKIQEKAEGLEGDRDSLIEDLVGFFE